MIQPATMKHEPRLFIGSHGATIQGERVDLCGDRCFSAPHDRMPVGLSTLRGVNALLDSGAFSDDLDDRLTPEQALDRQFAWERRAAERWQEPWTAYAFASYDMLIDETWENGRRYKRRWSAAAAEHAVRATVEAAAYLVSQRERLAGRQLVLGCQGVTPEQYADCVIEILKLAGPQDWIGLGGWCILGRSKRLLPSFWKTLYLIMPRIRDAGILSVHLFGVLWEKALGGFLWIADRYGLAISTDSSRIIRDCSSADPATLRRAGARAPYWRDNVAHWQETVRTLRQSVWYTSPCPLYEMEENGGAPFAGQGNGANDHTQAALV